MPIHPLGVVDSFTSSAIAAMYTPIFDQPRQVRTSLSLHFVLIIQQGIPTRVTRTLLHKSFLATVKRDLQKWFLKPLLCQRL